jgi:CheY-like chemotaxis protein
MGGLKVLVVEDSSLMAAVLEDLLKAAGAAQVILALSVYADLEVLRRQPIDLACLDIDLGAETSFPVADELARAGIPFVFISGRSPDNVPEAHRHRPFVSKLVDDADLIAVCLQAARSSHSQGLVGAA